MVISHPFTVGMKVTCHDVLVQHTKRGQKRRNPAQSLLFLRVFYGGWLVQGRGGNEAETETEGGDSRGRNTGGKGVTRAVAEKKGKVGKGGAKGGTS